MKRSRLLQVENLERRLMLAADVAAFQNPLDANDVNNDDYVTARDALIMIKIPSMDAVRAGRWRQEERAWKAAGASAQKTSHPGLMTRAEVDDYVALFERLTTAMLTRMPAYADILIEQDAHFRQDIVRIPTHPA